MNIGFVLENFTETVQVALDCLKMNLIGYVNLKIFNYGRYPKKGIGSKNAHFKSNLLDFTER